MKKSLMVSQIIFVALSLLTAHRVPAAPSLREGVLAPNLTVDTWLKGRSVPTFQRGRIYVVEFWATWCGPCIGAIPHLNEIARRSEVTVIGMNVEAAWAEPGGTPRDELLRTVNEFLDSNDPPIHYPVAFDP